MRAKEKEGERDGRKTSETVKSGDHFKLKEIFVQWNVDEKKVCKNGTLITSIS